jgi:hypothetical protein
MEHKAIALQEVDLPYSPAGHLLLYWKRGEKGSWEIFCSAASDEERVLLFADSDFFMKKETFVFNEQGILGCAATGILPLPIPIPIPYPLSPIPYPYL